MVHKTLIHLIITSFAAFGLVAGAHADIAAEDLPENVQWYAHADFKEMQGSVTGRYLLDFLEQEVFSELEQETGISLKEDLQAATVFGGKAQNDGAVVLYGKISDKNRTKMQALMEIYGEYQKETRKGVEVYAVNKRARDGKSADDDSSDLFSEARTTYLAFGKRNQTLITQNQQQLDDFLSAGGRITRSKSADRPGSLLVLQADQSMVKAGMNSTAGISDKSDWNSNILQHMQQIALVLSDQSGKAAIEAQLVTSNQELAESIKNIVQGLISIKSLDQDEDPEVLKLLRSIRLELAGATIKARMLIDPEMLREAIH